MPPIKPLRKSAWLISVSGVDGFFDTKTGGGKTANTGKYFGGGNDVPSVMKDRAVYADLVVGRGFVVVRDMPVIARLRPLVDDEEYEFAIAAQPLGPNRIPAGAPIRYRGLLAGLTEPDVDSEATGTTPSDFQHVLDRRGPVTAEPQVFGAPGPTPPTGPAAPAPRRTVLDDVFADLQATQDSEDVVTYTVKTRPGFEVRYSTAIDYGLHSARQLAATDPSMPNGVNTLLLAQATLSGQCLAVLKDGEDITDEHGKPVTFATPAFQRMLGVDRDVDAVRAFYRRDPHLIRSSDELLRDAGFGPEGVPHKR